MPFFSPLYRSLAEHLGVPLNPRRRWWAHDARIVWCWLYDHRYSVEEWLHEPRPRCVRCGSRERRTLRALYHRLRRRLRRVWRSPWLFGDDLPF